MGANKQAVLNARDKKRRKRIQPKPPSNAAKTSWRNVEPREFLEYFAAAAAAGVAATPMLRRDETALGIRLWHPDLDLENYWFSETDEGLIPDGGWAYLHDILAELDKEPSGQLEQYLEATR